MSEENLEFKEKADDIISAMFVSIANTSRILNKFSKWLGAGTGATVALFITQVDSILSHMSADGFHVCVFMLIMSLISAFVAKYFSLHCQIDNEIMKVFTERVSNIDEQQGATLDTNAKFNKFLTEYAKPFPNFMQGWIKRYVQNRQSKKYDSRGVGVYHGIAWAYHCQAGFTLLQAVMFIVFMCLGVWYLDVMEVSNLENGLKDS